jgi:TPR repeat protein
MRIFLTFGDLKQPFAGFSARRWPTYDPNVLARLGVVGMSAELEKARSWYQKAETLGSPDARRRLDLLANH